MTALPNDQLSLPLYTVPPMKFCQIATIGGKICILKAFFFFKLILLLIFSIRLLVPVEVNLSYGLIQNS